MTSVDAMKEAVTSWWMADDTKIEAVPEYIAKFLHVIFKLKKQVFNTKNGIWEYEGF